MANTHSTLTALFTDIADAIREKKNSTEPIIADSFPAEIESLRTGFDYANQDVTAIPDYAFYGCEDLLNVNCYNLTSVGTSAFEGCTKLKTIILYDGVESVGENAFKACSDELTIYCETAEKPDGWSDNWNPDGCEVVWGFAPVETWDIGATEEDNVTAKLYNDIHNEGYYTLVICGSGDVKNYGVSSDIPWYYHRENISSIIINNSVTSIGFGTFSDCTSLTSVNISDSVISIGANAFYNCSSLNSVAIPNSVINIGTGAFGGCTSLTSVTIPISVIHIGGYAFSDTAYYNDVSNWDNDVLYINNALIEAKTNISGDYVIKDGTTIVAGNAFSNCTSLTSINIPDDVTSIGNYAFSNCTSLTFVNIPDSVISIGENAFYSCTSLNSVTIPNSVINIGYRVFFSCTSLTSITIPDSVTSIGDYTFYNCRSLMSIIIPDSVTSIGYNAFENCRSLTSITIPDSVTTIGAYVFSNCTSLTSVIIGNRVVQIGGYMFINCNNLTSITIGNNCEISIGTFNDLPSLIWINAYDDNPTYKSIDGVLYSKNGDTIIAYPRNKTIINHDVLDGVKYLDVNAFRNCTSLTSIVIPNSVIRIGNYTFNGCTSLTSINYTGTIAQWNAITFGSNWNSSTGNYTIYCIDGTITKDGTITYYNT